jgi:hypothetical protein
MTIQNKLNKIKLKVNNMEKIFYDFVKIKNYAIKYKNNNILYYMRSKD